MLLLLATAGLVAGRLAGARLERALEWLVKPSSGETSSQANGIEELRRLAVVLDESTYRRELAEHAWAESAATCRMLFDDHPAPLWVLARDSLRFLDVNQAAVDRFGHGRERFKSLSASDLVAPEERSRLEDLTASARPGDAMAARRHVGPPAWGPMRWRLRAADGTRLDCDLRCRQISHLGQPALLVRLREQPAVTGKTTQEPARP
jgi:PAS domain-containing protein